MCMYNSSKQPMMRYLTGHLHNRDINSMIHYTSISKPCFYIGLHGIWRLNTYSDITLNDSSPIWWQDSDTFSFKAQHTFAYKNSRVFWWKRNNNITGPYLLEASRKLLKQKDISGGIDGREHARAHNLSTNRRKKTEWLEIWITRLDTESKWI